jgi:hypothetical protein
LASFVGQAGGPIRDAVAAAKRFRAARIYDLLDDLFPIDSLGSLDGFLVSAARNSQGREDRDNTH